MARTFPMGKVCITANALAILHPGDALTALGRHAQCDWGDVGEEHRELNEGALDQDKRLFSAYEDRDNVNFWIITEADRSSTTILLPEDY